MTSDLNMPQRIMFDFVSFPFSGFTLVRKLRNCDFESHWNTLIFFDKKVMSDLNMSCQIESDLVYTSLYELNFGNKLTNTCFKRYWKV